MSQLSKTGFRYLTLMSMFYMTIKLTTLVLVYKVIAIGKLSATASTLLMPLWFMIGDTITEVYGYKTARQLIWVSIFCQCLFAFFCAWAITLHAPSPWPHQEAYNFILDKLPRVALASSLAILSGAFINAYAISKWKILLKGRFFWLRCLAASSVGEFVFTVIAYLAEFLGLTSSANLLELMTVSYAIKLLLNPILVIPSTIIAAFLKRAEGIDAYDYGVNFNPFKTT